MKQIALSKADYVKHEHEQVSFRRRDIGVGAVGIVVDSELCRSRVKARLHALPKP